MTPHSPSSPAPDGPDRHPEPDVLADLAEDLVDPAEAAELRRHLDGCPSCAEDYAALTDIGLLFDAIDPGPMPADLADRIDAALAAAAAGPEPDEAALGSDGPRRPHTPAPRPTADRPGTSSRPAGRNAPASPGGPGGPGRAGRRRRASFLLLGAAALTGLLTVGGLALRGSSSTAGDSTAAAGGSPNLTSASSAQPRPEYREDTLAAQVRQLLAGAASAPTTATGKGSQPALQPERDPGSTLPAVPAPQACVTEAVGRPGQTPVAGGPGRYGATDVTVLVYPASGTDGEAVEVYLVTPQCPGAKVLLHRTVPTP
ncbi:zf-HC2 domain-containing protein [Kitasatospora camelliae]|uniref:Zf-HC2 domain-containing protein n=1 Tax=Kitasatospora camelliae TaxID=3156397 RepID=A0AAU8JZG7_9ACTN